MEWFTAANSGSKGPNDRGSPATTTTLEGSIRCSRTSAVRNAKVSVEPTTGSRLAHATGTAPPRCGPRDRGSERSPRCPGAGPGSRRSRGGSRPPPAGAPPGKSTAQSTTSSLPSYSKTVMFRPTSPRPPRATTRRPPAASGGGVPRLWCGWLMCFLHLRLTDTGGRCRADCTTLAPGRARRLSLCRLPSMHLPRRKGRHETWAGIPEDQLTGRTPDRSQGGATGRRPW
jgi:hypothetical protein